MSKIRLAVLYGGISGEHEVSCLSAASILKNLTPSRYDVTSIGVTKDGRWFRQPPWSGSPLTVLQEPSSEVSVRPGLGLSVAGKPLELDAVFPIMHGIQGEDGSLQGLLQCSGLPYVGAGVLASALGMDKVYAKRLWSAMGLPVVPSLALTAESADKDQGRAAYEHAIATLGPVLFVKPSNSGSSVGVSKVTSFEAFGPALAQAWKVDRWALVETAVEARELEVAVIGGATPRAYGPGEIVPNHEFYDYDAKYTDPDGADLVIPAHLPTAVRTKILNLAVQAYQGLGTEGFARVDFFVDKKSDQVWINEINTLPGFTTISMFPRMAVAGGLTYAGLLDSLVDQALARRL